MRVAFALLFFIALSGCGQARPAGQPLSHDRVGAAASTSAITVTSGGVGPDGKIAARHGARAGNLSPPLAWSPVAAAASYAVILEDPDADAPRPWGHWLIWNIPGSVTALSEGVAIGARPPRPAGAAQGLGDAGDVGYFGPKPPSGVHHYHFEVFALDRALALPGGANRDALLAAMRGHVLGWGELIGTFAAPS